MPQVDVTINGHDYRIACDDGQEEHLTQLAEYVDKRVQELVTSVGQVGDSRLLVMTSLLIADELSEAYADIERQNSSADAGPGDRELAEIIDSAAARIEGIAAGLEGA